MHIKDKQKSKCSTLTKLLSGMVSEGEVECRKKRPVNLRFNEVDDRFVWICDDDRRIGLIDRESSTLEWIAPHPGKKSIRPIEIPSKYHAPTYQGGRIVLQWWLNSDGGWRRESSEPLANPIGFLKNELEKSRGITSWKLGSKIGSELTLRTIHHHPGDGRIVGEHNVKIFYDPLADSYVAEVRAVLRTPDPYYAEFCNLLAGGCYDTRPANKRYQATIWSHPDKRLVRWPHNPISYLTPGMNEYDGERQIAIGGYIGYFADPYTNPVVEIIEANHAVAAATCCNIYDEHLICLPSKKNKDSYSYEALYRFKSIHQEIAAEIVSHSSLIDFKVDTCRNDPVLFAPDSTEPDLARRLVCNPILPGFYYGRINDFEEPIPYDILQVGNFIWASSCPENSVFWDDDCGRSGKHSIRLRGESEDQTVSTSSSGPTPHINPNTKYRLSCWIRCENVIGEGAFIKFNEIGFNQAMMKASHFTKPLRGTTAWTYVERVFKTCESSELGWLYLELTGAGQAWFDDVALEIIRNESC